MVRACIGAHLVKGKVLVLGQDLVASHELHSQGGGRWVVLGCCTTMARCSEAALPARNWRAPPCILTPYLSISAWSTTADRSSSGLPAPRRLPRSPEAAILLLDR